MIPHTLVLKPGLVIHSVYNGYWFWCRASLRRDQHGEPLDAGRPADSCRWR